MHNLKYIRTNIENFKKKIKERNINLDVDTLIKLDKKNRELILEKEKLLHENASSFASEKLKSSKFEQNMVLVTLIICFTTCAKAVLFDFTLVSLSRCTVAKPTILMGYNLKTTVKKVLNNKSKIDRRASQKHPDVQEMWARITKASRCTVFLFL